MCAWCLPLAAVSVLPALVLCSVADEKKLLTLNWKRTFFTNATIPRPARSGFHFPRQDARFHDGDEVQLETVHTSWLSLSDDPAFTLRGRQMALKSVSNGKFCGLQPGHTEGRLSCQHQYAPRSAWLQVSHHDGTPTVRDSSHMALRLVLDESNSACTDSPSGLGCWHNPSLEGGETPSDDWKDFGIINAGDGKIALRGSREGHFCAVKDDRIVCDSEQPVGDAVFEAVTDDPLTAVIVQSKDPAAAATFIVERKDMKSSSVALRCKGQDRYVAADEHGGRLGCSSKEPWTALHSRVSWWDATSATLRSPKSHLFFEAGDPELDSEVKAVNLRGNGWALFKVLLVAGYETVWPLVRGVSLGNWFLLEKWMNPDLFTNSTGSPFTDPCAAIDEHGLLLELGARESKQRMEKHWSTWITEQDIVWLARNSINAVRVPFGYWMVYPSAPFVFGQLKYLKRLFKWCERHSIAVLLDYHGLKGSQTGQATSGDCGACGRDECGKTKVDFLKEQRKNLEVIDALTTLFSKSPAYFGFAIANEVASTVDSKETMHFYAKAYDIIRSKNKDAIIIMFATFNPSSYPFNGFVNVAQDVHVYFGMNFKGGPSLDQRSNLERARKAVAPVHWPVLVGEWSLGGSGHAPHGLGASQHRQYFKEFARMQLQAWETHSTGWFYWSYKTSYPNSTWNFRDMCEAGWLPGCGPTEDGISYGPTKWLSAPACAYDYLGGGCAPPSEPPPAWPFGLALLVAAGAAAIAALRPQWVANSLNAPSLVVHVVGKAASAVIGSLPVSMSGKLGRLSRWLPQCAGWRLITCLHEDKDEARSPSSRQRFGEGSSARGSGMLGLPGPARLASQHNNQVLIRMEPPEQPFIW